MDNPINERFIKLSSKILYPNELFLGEDLTVIIQGNAYIFNVVKEEINDLQNGTVNKTYVCKSLSE